MVVGGHLFEVPHGDAHAVTTSSMHAKYNSYEQYNENNLCVYQVVNLVVNSYISHQELNH